LQIDWLTVAAQIVNFLVLVWLLKRFLYKPITNAMRHREEQIEERLSEAKAARQEAEEEAQELRQKEEKLEARKDEILNDAHKEAEDLRARLDTEIREDMEEKRAAWKQHLAEEQEAFVASLQRQAGKQILEIVERVLSDYADTDTTERVVATFTKHLEALDQNARENMTKAAAEQDEPAVVQTGTKIGSATKGQITRAIRKALSTDIDIDYREDPNMVFGVRLNIGDYTVEWSAIRYLKRLEMELGEIIDAGTSMAGDSKQKAADSEAADEDDDNRRTQTEDHETA